MTDADAHYACDHCGACCRHHIVEAALLDALREPKIAERAELADGRGKLPLADAVWMLAVGAARPCPFLQADNGCEIYATRPTVCVAYQAGSEQCQEARAANGLPPLEPTAGNGAVLHQIEALYREDEDS